MKLIVNLGKELSDAEITFSNPIPVTKNFDFGNIIGEAEISISDDYLIAEVDAKNHVFSKMPERFLECGVSVLIKEMKDNVIMSAEIQSCSVKYREL